MWCRVYEVGWQHTCALLCGQDGTQADIRLQAPRTVQESIALLALPVGSREGGGCAGRARGMRGARSGPPCLPAERSLKFEFGP